MMQFLYRLELLPEFADETTWSAKEEEVVGDHFNYLKSLNEKGTVALAGRTLVEGDGKFGIVILQAETEEEANEIMENDPAVSGRLMQATLYPFQIALS
ncbi:YciI family protein [Thalassobacillus hwangdonensis]|uniref:YciI family protein n=1 Tax=Thalassobacillus hwangdonensis TaxID=546108 RepID=A0ABW3L1R1_9BACI